MDYNAEAVQVLEVVDRSGHYFADGLRQGFVVRKDSGMLAVAVGREQVLEAQDENAVTVGLSIPEKVHLGSRQVESIATTLDGARVLVRTSGGEMVLSTAVKRDV